jgi:hypothetical protein
MSLRNLAIALASLVAGALVVLLLFEALFRVLPTTSGLNPTKNTSAVPLHAYEESRPYQYSFGWAMLNAHNGKTNNYGHIAPHDYHTASRPMIVIGDSYVESLMNAYADTIQGQLGERLGSDHPVYGLGVSALSASDYVMLARQARDEFKPRAAVFLITDGDMVESFASHPGGYSLVRDGSNLITKFRPLSPSPAMEWIRAHIGRIALYDYVRMNLKFSPTDIFSALKFGVAAPAAARAAPAYSSNGREALDWFLSELPSSSGVRPECTVLLVDSDRYAIYDPSAASTPKDAPETRNRLIERGTELGFHVVDLAPLFAAEYERTRLKLDYWPVDRHWNRHGHKVAADAVMTALYDGRPDSPCLPGTSAELTSN